MGFTITQRIKDINQPRGGYLNPRNFRQFTYSEGVSKLNPCENLSPFLIGLAVDYLTRYVLTGNLRKSFDVSTEGARINDMSGEVEDLLSFIESDTDLDSQDVLSDGVIKSTLKFCGIAMFYRFGVWSHIPIESIEPDADTIFNIRVMIDRAVRFFKVSGTLVKCGFTFDGGYTNKVITGDGDYLVSECLFSMKVSKRPITKEHTLQILMHYIMGLHSKHTEFLNIKSLGIYNPRLDTSYIMDVSDIHESTIQAVEKEVICYT